MPDQNPNQKTRSCAKEHKANLEFFSKKSILKTDLQVNSRPNFHSISFLKVPWTILNQKHSSKPKELVYRTWDISWKLHNRILQSKHFYSILFMDSCSLWSSEANQYIWLCFYALYTNMPCLIFRVYRVLNWGFLVKEKLVLQTKTIQFSAWRRRRNTHRAQFMNAWALVAIFLKRA